MKEYSETVRARMVARLMGPRSVPVSRLSAESGIPEGTLYRWLKAAARMPEMASTRARGSVSGGSEAAQAKRGDRPRSGAEKLAIVARAEGLAGEELGEFLRREGVHGAELEAWRKLAAQALQGEPKRIPPSKEMRKLKAELARKEKALAEAAALLVLKKSGGDLGGRGRRHGRDERRMIVELVDEAVAAGARQLEACRAVGVAATTLARWKASPDVEDARRGPLRKPSNALTHAEEREVLALLNAPEHSSMSPDTLVPHLATMGIYVASQSTFYRLLRRERLLRCRGRARPRTHRRPQEHVATGPNQVWAWDITYLPTVVRGRFLKLYDQRQLVLPVNDN